MHDEEDRVLEIIQEYENSKSTFIEELVAFCLCTLSAVFVVSMIWFLLQL